MAGKNSGRIFYFDALRAFAILCVVLLHVTGHLAEMMNYDIVSVYSLSGTFEIFSNNFFRIAVDLFVMLSGALLLGREWEVKEFFSRRIPRIAKPFVFWSLVFSAVLIAASYFSPGMDYVTGFALQDMANVFFETLLCRAPGSAVYWFVWMMLWVYLTMPAVNRWVKKASSVDLEYFLGVWMIFILACYYINNQYLLVLSEFLSPVALAVFGCYLRHSGRRICNDSAFALILILVPAVLMFAYSYMVAGESVLFAFHRYSILVVIEAVGVFCLFKSSRHINNPGEFCRKVISSVAICSYGMYLIHSQMIMVVRKVLHISFGFSIDYILFFAVGFFLSWAIIYILSKIPVMDALVGVK